MITSHCSGVPPFTCGSSTGSMVVVLPVTGSRMPVTRRGLNTLPLAASTAATCAFCIGVTGMKPWPTPKFTESPGYQRAHGLVLGVAEALASSRLCDGRTPRLLARDVDAGLLAIAEGREELVHLVHAQLHGQRVEIHVAGLGDGGAQRHRAMHAAPAFARDAAAAGHPVGTRDSSAARSA